MIVSLYPKYFIDKSFIQHVCTSMNAKEKRVTDDYKNTEIRISWAYNQIRNIGNNQRYGLLQLKGKIEGKINVGR